MKELFFKILQTSKEEGNRSFSSFISTPFFWSVIGPLLLMIGFVIFLSKVSFGLMFIGCIASLGYPFSWKYDIKGAVYSAGLLIFSVAFLLLTGLQSFDLFWSLIGTSALLTSFLVIAVSSKAYQAYHEDLKQQEEQKLFKMQSSYQTNQQYLENQLEQAQQIAKILEKNFKSQEKEMDSFKQLMIACKEEADQYFDQSEYLKKQLDVVNQQILFFERKEDEIQIYKEKNKILLKQLNDTRVANYQHKLLAEDGYKKLKEQAHQLTSHEQEIISKEFQELQKERAEMKKIYHQHLRDYQAISHKLEALFSFDEKMESSSEGPHHELTTAFEDKGKILQEVRLDILKTEEAILHLKKELKISHDEGLTPGSYLAIADQECLRLEEENTLLLKLLTQLFPKNGKKDFEDSFDQSVNFSAENVT